MPRGDGMRHLVHHHIRKQGFPSFLPAVLITLLLFGVFCSRVGGRLRPVIETMALSSVRGRISETTADAVAACVTEQGLAYHDFITVERDSNGSITSLTSNLSAASLLKRDLVAFMTAELDQLRQEDFGIPLGTLTGWMIFSGKGPEIRVKLLTIGDVAVQMQHNFCEAGINQTLHQVYLDVSVTVYIMIPGETLSTTADSSVCVAETVIVGQVPDTYLYVGNGEN